MLANEAARRRENPTPEEAAEAALEAIVAAIEVRLVIYCFTADPSKCPSPRYGRYCGAKRHRDSIGGIAETRRFTRIRDASPLARGVSSYLAPQG